MIKIGIVPTRELSERENNPYKYSYKIYEKFVEPVYKNNAIPIIVFPVKDVLENSLLNECDGFIIAGGNKIESYHLDIINYAIVNNKPLLGICLGSQCIGVYSLIEDYLNNNKLEFNRENINKAYSILKENKVMFLKPVENHYIERINNDNFDINTHEIEVINNTILYDIYQKNIIKEISMHNYVLNEIGNNIKISAMYNGVIEGIEYDNKDLFIIGTQYHPELNYNDNTIFDRLIKECEKRIK